MTATFGRTKHQGLLYPYLFRTTKSFKARSGAWANVSKETVFRYAKAVSSLEVKQLDVFWQMEQDHQLQDKVADQRIFSIVLILRTLSRVKVL
jgi:hypothetical protein